MTPRESLRRIQETFLGVLASELSPLGFKAKRLEQVLFALHGGNRWIIHVSFIRHKVDVDATLDLGVRLEEVEKRLSSAGFGSKSGVTVGAELGNLTDGRPKRWTLHDSIDSGPVAVEMRREIQNFGLEWFVRASDPEAVFELLGLENRLGQLYSPIPVKRCLTLVALAVNRDRARAAAVVAGQCRTWLLERNDPQLPVFDACTEKLLGQK